jgi:hypothetical protein
MRTGTTKARCSIFIMAVLLTWWTGSIHVGSCVGVMTSESDVLCAGALLFVDTVCTLGGVPLHVDADELDIVYSGSQKCLGAPPGASPLTLSPRAMAKLAARKTKVRRANLLTGQASETPSCGSCDSAACNQNSETNTSIFFVPLQIKMYTPQLPVLGGIVFPSLLVCRSRATTLICTRLAPIGASRGLRASTTTPA